MKTQTINDRPLDATMFKSFANYSDFIKKTPGLSVTVKMAGSGWFVPVTKKALKKVADRMSEYDKKFCGLISYAGGGQKWAQITME